MSRIIENLFSFRFRGMKKCISNNKFGFFKHKILCFLLPSYRQTVEHSDDTNTLHLILQNVLAPLFCISLVILVVVALTIHWIRMKKKCAEKTIASAAEELKEEPKEQAVENTGSADIPSLDASGDEPDLLKVDDWLVDSSSNNEDEAGAAGVSVATGSREEQEGTQEAIGKTRNLSMRRGANQRKQEQWRQQGQQGEQRQQGQQGQQGKLGKIGSKEKEGKQDRSGDEAKVKRAKQDITNRLDKQNMTDSKMFRVNKEKPRKNSKMSTGWDNYDKSKDLAEKANASGEKPSNAACKLVLGDAEQPRCERNGNAPKSTTSYATKRN